MVFDSIRSDEAVKPCRISCLMIHAASDGSFYPGLLWRTLGAGYATNGVPS
jgi:hypothetical protein